MAKFNNSGRNEASVRAETERLKRELRALGAIDIWGAEELPCSSSRTDHLSDRALYERLHGEVLPDEMDELRTDDGAAWRVDILGGCSLEGIRLYLKYYADEKQRRAWARKWPDDDMPPHEDPPYDRDRLLPAPEW